MKQRRMNVPMKQLRTHWSGAVGAGDGRCRFIFLLPLHLWVFLYYLYTCIIPTNVLTINIVLIIIA